MIRALLLTIAVASPALAEDALATRTAAANTRLSQAAEMLAEAPHSGQEVLATAGAIRAYEDGMIALNAGLADLSGRYETAKSSLALNRDQMASLVTAAQASSRATITQVAHPAGARAQAQAGMLLPAVAPAITAEMADLRQELADFSKLHALHNAATDARTVALAEMAAAEAALRLALEDHADLSARFTENPVDTAVLAATAETPEAFLAGLATLHSGGLPNDATLAAKGTLPIPVTGRATDQDTGDAGMIIATPAKALVVSPSPATILYQGPLFAFETAVVLEPTAGMLLVLGGLQEVFGTPGQIMPSGWPLGLMPDAAPSSDTNLTTNLPSNAGNTAKALYLAVWEGQTPVDPGDWFALAQEMDEE